MLSGNTDSPDFSEVIARIEAHPDFPMKKSILYDLRRQPNQEGGQKALDALKQVRKNRREEWTEELEAILQSLSGSISG
jgi:hypothetical protein